MADIKVYGTLRTMATDGIVATADQLKDTNVGKFQEVINQELAGGMEGKQDTIADLEQIRSLSNSAVQPSVLQAAIADFITKSVDDLVNYYKKSETYTKAEVNGLIGAIKQFTYRVAPSLPTASESTMYIIYLIPSSNASTQNVKDEFITIQDGSSYSWEQIGSTKIDLSGYSTTEEMNAAITSALNTALSDYYDKAGVDELLSNYAHKDGFYETLGAGTALNLQGNTLLNATFTYRTAGGTEDIASGLATIHSIKGNTVVWNQLLDNTTMYNKCKKEEFNVTLTDDGNLRLIAKDGLNKTYRYCSWDKTEFTPTPNHIVYVSADVTDVIHPETNHVGGIWYKCGHNGSTTTLLKQGAIKEFDKPLTKGFYRQIQTVEQTTASWLLQLGCTIYNSAGKAVATSTGGWGIEVKSINIIDLTLMFGAGNEPSTVEEFEEWLTNNVGLQDYYEYSEPTMLSADANSLETVGFNLWDSSYSKTNYYLDVDGNEVSNNNYNITNFISVFPNTDYFINKINSNQPSVCFYDFNKQFISGIKYGGSSNKLFTTPTNAAYLKFSVYKSAANQTNLNLSWSGIRNGEYEEYWKRTYPINVKQLTNNGNVIFPNGMNRVGNVYDEIVNVEGVTKAIKRIGSVDLGTLSWTKMTNTGANQYYFRSSKVSDIKYYDYKKTQTIICQKYQKAVMVNIEAGTCEDKTISANNNGHLDFKLIYVYDSSYTDAATFKAAMDGVMLYYELATPIEYEIDNFEMPLAYKVDDFGTEETKKDTFSLSPTFAITYGVNAVDTLRRLPTNYISKESMQNFLSALGVQMGGTWTMTLDNNEYKFSFVANPEATINDDGV